jgi:hypothetical protein
MKWYDYTAVTILITLVLAIWLHEPKTAVLKIDVTCDSMCMIRTPEGIVSVHEDELENTLLKLQMEYWEENELYLVYKITTNNK